jgi:Lrp/AsnC family leucine-responsive transcriptional regulator
MSPEHTNDSFEAAIAKLEAVIDADHVTGRFDYQLRVACRDTAELDALLRALRLRLGAADTETKIVLRSGPPKPAIE